MIASELEAALRQNLRDETAWTVYADWLGSQGDSRGELIGYEQRAEREPDPVLASRWRQQSKLLFEREHRRWLGPLVRSSVVPTWLRGFVIEAHIFDRIRWTAETLLRMRTGALIYRMAFTRLPDCRPVADALAGSWVDVVELRSLDTAVVEPIAAIENLRELLIERSRVDDLEVLAELPALERLLIHRSELDLAAFESGFAALRQLVVTDHGKRPSPPLDAVDLSGLARLPALEFLDLHGSRVVDLGPLAELPKLRQIDISNTNVRSLAPLDRIATLERVDAIGISVARVELERLTERGVYIEQRPKDGGRGP